MPAIELKGNKGEWAELYTFLRLIVDGKIYAADEKMNAISTVFLNIIKIIREEIKGNQYNYCPGDTIKIFLNGAACGPDKNPTEYNSAKDAIWAVISTAPRGNNIKIPSISAFLDDIHVTKLKSPSFKTGKYFGGTEDITMEVMDYRSGITSVVGFSIKSDISQPATLFNASGDNTNFVYQIHGIDDAVMDAFNSMFDAKGHVATQARLSYLKSQGASIEFIDTALPTSKRNIVLSGGKEMPKIIGEMLLNYYWNELGKAEHSSLSENLKYAIDNNVAEYPFEEVESIYQRKLGTLLYDMFTGMRLGKPWNGRSTVNGGYIVVKDSGEVVAYHTCIADEFKNFLITRLGFERPSCTRHKCMSVYKKEGHYFLNFNLQIRF